MESERERLTETAELQAIAAAKAERWWHRAPFIYTLLCGVVFLIFLGGAWTKSIAIRLEKIEDLSEEYKKEKIVETVHQNRRDIDRNAKQIRSLNVKVFGLPDPGEP